MTLAVFFFVSVSCTAWMQPPLAALPARQSAEQAVPTAKTPSTDGTTKEAQDQGKTPPAEAVNKPAASAQAPSAKKPSASKPRRKKKVAASNCVPAAAKPSTSAASGSTAADSTSEGTAQTDPLAAGSPPAPNPPTVCPPSKIIVRQGGTSEPTIRLAGGAVGDQAVQQRDTANQMLAATQTNLKKIAGRQLTANQQDMVNQIHQFIDQSRNAVASGDLERARTLAWKAQLLSEELVKPDK